MNAEFAIVAAMVSGAGMTSKAAAYRAAGKGNTSHEIAAATGYTPRHVRSILGALVAEGVCSVYSDNDGIVGRPAYRWHMSSEAAAAYYLGHDASAAHKAAFFDDISTFLYQNRRAKR